MKIHDVMTRDVEIASPDDTIETAARIMKDIGVGALPVGENDRLIGVVTDRDITLRAVAEGKSPTETKVRAVMTAEVQYVFDDEEVEEVARKMAQWRVRRVPLLNRDKRLVGIVSLGDLAFTAKDEAPLGEALSGIAQPTAATSSRSSSHSRARSRRASRRRSSGERA